MSKYLSIIKIFSVGLTITWMVVGSMTVAAAGTGIFKGACGSSNEGAVCANEVTSDPLTGPDGLITKVIKDVALFAGVAAIIIIIIGGFMYILSNGDSGKVSTAKDTIIYAAVGLVIIAVGQTIIVFVIDRI